jgi:hypothetical protein
MKLFELHWIPPEKDIMHPASGMDSDSKYTTIFASAQI